MDYAYRVLKNMKYFYNTINPATLSGENFKFPFNFVALYTLSYIYIIIG